MYTEKHLLSERVRNEQIEIIFYVCQQFRKFSAPAHKSGRVFYNFTKQEMKFDKGETNLYNIK